MSSEVRAGRFAQKNGARHQDQINCAGDGVANLAPFSSKVEEEPGQGTDGDGPCDQGDAFSFCTCAPLQMAGLGGSRYLRDVVVGGGWAVSTQSL